MREGPDGMARDRPSGIPDPGPGLPRPHLTDFGLAKSVATGSKLTRTGEALGTPTYMSPEQARGETGAPAPATDVWSLGCVLHEMLVGRAPFAGETPAAIVGKVLLAEPPDLRALAPGLPVGLARVVAVCLQKRARARYRDASALRGDLDRVLAGEAPRARPPASARWRAIAAVAVAGAAAWAVLLRRGGVTAEDPAPPPSLARPEEALAARARSLRPLEPANAASLLGDAIAAAPDRHDLRLERGLLLWALGRGAEAREEWGRVPLSGVEGPTARLYRGLECVFRRAPTEGRDDLEIAAGAPGSLGQLARGALALGREDWREARARLEGETDWMGALLRAYVEDADPAGDKTAAIRGYGVALAEGIPFAWVLLNRAGLRQEAGDPKRAVEDADAALAVVPGWGGALVNRANARLDLGDAIGALTDLEAALAADPEDPEALTSRARARLGTGDAAGAEADATAALRSVPARFRYKPLNNRGSARAALGDWRGALEDHTAALAAKPGHPEALFNRGNARRALGDPAGATEDYTAALLGRPGWPAPLLNRGLAREDMGDPARAIEDYTAALRLDPGLAEALNNRGSARVRLGDADAAIEDYRAALRARPGYASPHRNLGVLQLRRGDTRAAAESFREFLRLAPQDRRAPQVRASLEECERQLGIGGASSR
ncbi:MAG: tetratricopeptide repeat protein [Planctomycetales bacterium]|nr:tetratricopeptide repeat protein [Planctomycetales bacterium]